jgi:hypothetical protein
VARSDRTITSRTYISSLFPDVSSTTMHND